MSIKKDLKARGLFINKRKRTEMMTVMHAIIAGTLAVGIALTLLGSITSY